MSEVSCPRCGSDMVLKTARKGKNAGPSLKEEMIRTYEVISRNAESVEIRESCERLIQAMRREI